jgi:hypothetical protein
VKRKGVAGSSRIHRDGSRGLVKKFRKTSSYAATGSADVPVG